MAAKNRLASALTGRNKHINENFSFSQLLQENNQLNEDYLSELQRRIQLSTQERKRLENQKELQINRVNLLKTKEKLLNQKFETTVKRLNKVKHTMAFKASNMMIKTQAKETEWKMLEEKRKEIQNKRTTSMPKRQYDIHKRSFINKSTTTPNKSMKKNQISSTSLPKQDSKQISQIIQKKENLKRILVEIIKVDQKVSERSRQQNKTSHSFDNIKSSARSKI